MSYWSVECILHRYTFGNVIDLREVLIGVFYLIPPKPDIAVTFPYTLDVNDAAV